MLEWFDKQPKLVKVLLLIFPVINWVVEIILRVLAVLKKSSSVNVIGLVLSCFIGVLIGWIDAILVLTDGSYILLD